jgi:hypothetical protein
VRKNGIHSIQRTEKSNLMTGKKMIKDRIKDKTKEEEGGGGKRS